MKLWIFKNGINVTEASFCIQNLLCGNMSRSFKMVPCTVPVAPSGGGGKKD